MSYLIVITEVLLLSLGISFAIKYLAPLITITPSATNALILVMTPALVLAIALFTNLLTQRANYD
jgi:hypothetical protein